MRFSQSSAAKKQTAKVCFLCFLCLLFSINSSQSTTVDGGAPTATSWTQDANGSETAQQAAQQAAQNPARVNGWDFEGHLSTVGTQGQSTGYTQNTYDTSGNRLYVTTGMGTPQQASTAYLVDPNTSYASIVQERDNAGVLQARWVWEGSVAPLAMYRRDANGVYRRFFYLTDGQDSVRQLTDDAGNVTDSYFYDAWGNGLGGGSGSTVNPFRYTGQQLDGDGKYFLRARYYNSGTGRFLSHDPVMGSESDPITLHRYVYAGNDAVQFSDPGGREFSMAGMSVGMGVHNSMQNIKADVDMGILQDVSYMFGGPDFSTEGTIATILDRNMGTNFGGGGFGPMGAARAGKGGGKGGGGFKMMRPMKARRAARGWQRRLKRLLREIAEDAGDSGRECFVAGTRVVMADGTSKPIEKIKKGDYVLSRDAKTGKTSAKKVVQTFQHQAPATLVLHFKGGQRIETTEGHPFYVRGKGFVKAGELGIGTSIVTRAGPAAELLKVERKDAAATVYNFEVEDFHTYFVGSGLWVHNDCDNIVFHPDNFNEHVILRHTRYGSERNGDSYFDETDESLLEYIIVDIANRSAKRPPRLQLTTGRYEWIVYESEAGVVGWDADKGERTGIYTVITEENGDLYTAFPGMPRPETY